MTLLCGLSNLDVCVSHTHLVINQYVFTQYILVFNCLKQRKSIKMKFKKTMVATFLMLCVSSSVKAEDQGHGKVTFTGAIIDSPCSISPESIDQTVELGQVSNVALKDGGQSTPRNFQIHLENCELSDVNKVSLTFTGMESNEVDGLLGITGTAKGAAVAITDGSGQLIELAKPTPTQELQDGSNTLSFSAYLQGTSNTENEIIPGEFQSVADFTLAYQ